MTICVGMLCRDGIALAADTQESYGENKSYVAKIFPVGSANQNIVIAGAGLASFIDYAKEKIATLRDADNADTFETKVRELMRDFYAEEFRLYPCAEELKQIELLVAVQFRKEFPFLLHIDCDLVKRVHDARAIGAGMFTQMAIDFHSMHLTTAQAVWACMYIVKEAKMRYEGIGGSTHIVVVTGDGFQTERSWDIPQRETVLSRFDALARRLLIATIPATAEGMLNASMKSAADLLRVTRRDMEAFDRQFAKAVKVNEAITERSRKNVSKVAERVTQKQKQQS
jgi:20S proteasome alpha/beta subunit